MTLLGSPRRLVSEDRLAGPAAVDSYSVRSWRAHTLETWPSTVQLIIAPCNGRGVWAPRQTCFMVWLENKPVAGIL